MNEIEYEETAAVSLSSISGKYLKIEIMESDIYFCRQISI